MFTIGKPAPDYIIADELRYALWSGGAVKEMEDMDNVQIQLVALDVHRTFPMLPRIKLAPHLGRFLITATL